MTDHGFRNCTADDAEFILGLKRSCMKWYIEKIYGWDEEVQRQKTLDELSRLSGKMRIITSGGEDIGVTAFYEDNGVYVVGLIIIHPEYQNKGVASSIIGRYIETAKAEKKKITVKAYIENPARRLYERLGFRLREVIGTHAYYEMDFSEGNT